MLWLRFRRCWTCWRASLIRAGRGATLQAAPCAAVLHPRRRGRVQLVSRRRTETFAGHRHLHRRPPPQAERGLRPELAPRACAHRRPLHPPGVRPGRGGGGLPPPRCPAAGGAHHAGAGQRRSRWQDTARQRRTERFARLRQVQRSRCGAGAERVRHRHRADARAYRHRTERFAGHRTERFAGHRTERFAGHRTERFAGHRRKVQRDPGGAGLAGRTRPCPRHHRHPRRNALPKNIPRPRQQPVSP